MANNIATYIKNLGKSVVYSSVDLVKQNAPATSSVIETNQELFKEVYHSVGDYRTTLDRIRGVMQGSKVYEAAEYGLKSALDDLQTGKFYNKEREDEGFAKAGGSMFDMSDMDISAEIGDSGSSSSSRPSDVTTGDMMISDAINQSSRQSAEVVSNTIISTTRASIEANKASTNLLYAQNARLMENLRSGITDVASGIHSMHQFNVTTMQTHAQNSKVFFENANRLLQEQNAMMKEMLEMQRVEYKAKQEMYKKKEVKEGQKKLRYDDIVNANGIPDLKAYANNVLQNAKNNIPGGDQLFSEDGNILMAFASNPLRFLPDMLVKTMVGPSVMKAMKTLDKSISGIFGTLVGKMNKMAKDDEGSVFSQILGKIFGIRDSVKSSIDTGNYDKGPIPFDGTVKKAIVDVIPTHLRKIESLLSGKGERTFDYDKGKWEEVAGLKKRLDDMEKSSKNSAFSDVHEDMGKILKQVAFESNRDKKRFYEDLEKLFSKIYSDGGFFDINDAKDDDYLDYGVSSSENMQMIRAMMNRLPRHKMMQMAGNVQSARGRHNRQMEDLETIGGIFNSLFDNSGVDSYIKRDKRNQDIITGSTGTLGQNLITQLDDKGHNMFYYLQNVYKELSYIRQYGAGIGGGTSSAKIRGRRGVVGRPSIDSIDIPNVAGKTLSQRYNEDDIREDENYIRDMNKQREKSRLKGHRMTNISSDREFKENLLSLKVTAREVLNRSDNEEFNQEYEDMPEIYKLINESASDVRKKNNEKLAEINNKSQGSFLDRLIKAGSLGEKFAVIQDGIDNLMTAPGAMLTSVLTKADESIYNFFYGTETGLKDDKGNPIKGFFNRMVYEMKSTFSKVNTWIDDTILKPFKKKMDADTIGGAFKNMLGAVGIDVDGIKESLINAKDSLLDPIKERTKSMFSGAYDMTKDAFKDAYSQASNLANVSVDDSLEKKEEEAKQKAAEVQAAVAQHASGARYITKSGITAISEGEMIVPSELNPFNPNRGKVNKSQEIKNEKAIKSDFADFLTNAISENANGDQLVNGEENTLVKGINRFKAGTKEFGAQIFGSDKALSAAVDDIGANVKKYLPNGVAGGLLGGAIGLGTGLLSPLVAAVGGSAISIAATSEKAQEYLFGEKIYDKEGNETGRSGGLFSKETQETVQKYLPDLKTFGITGTVLGMVTPLGPLGGLLLGSAITYAKHSDRMREMFFGDNDGLINKDRRDMIANAMPNIAAATLGTLFLGPFGLLGNAALGTGLGLLSTTDEFKDVMLGKVGDDGKRQGGLAGLIRESVVNPLGDFASKLKTGLLDFLEKDLLDPIKRSISPLTKDLKEMIGWTFGMVGKGINWMFAKTLGQPLDNLIKERIINPVGKAMGKVINGVLKPTKGLIAAPFKALGWFGDKRRSAQIKKGSADYMTADERLDWRLKNGIKGDAFENFDEILASSDRDSLDEMHTAMKAIRGGTGFVEKEKNKAIDDLWQAASKLTRAQGRDKVVQLLHAGKVKEAQEIIFKAEGISTKDKEALSKSLQSKAKALMTIRNHEENYSNTKQGIYQNLKNKFGIENISDDNINKYIDMLEKEKASKIGADATYNESDKQFQAVSDELNQNTRELVVYFKEAVDLLKEIKEGNAKMTDIQQRSTEILDENFNTSRESHMSRANRGIKNKAYNIEKLYGQGSLSEDSRYALHDNPDRYDVLMNLQNKSGNINSMLGMKDQDFYRMSELHNLGYDVKDYDKFKGMSDTAYSNLHRMSKLGYKFNDASKVMNLSASDMNHLEEMYRLHPNMTFENAMKLKNRRGQILRHGNKVDEVLRNNKMNVSEDGSYVRTNEAFSPAVNSLVEGYNARMRGPGTLSTLRGLAKTTGKTGLSMLGHLLTPRLGDLGDIASDSKPIKNAISNKIGMFAKGTDEVKKNGLAAVSKDELIVDKNTKTEMTEDGAVTYKKTNDGSWEAVNSKDNREALSAKENRDKTQTGILDSLKNLNKTMTDMVKNTLGLDKEKKKKDDKPWWQQMLDLLGTGGAIYMALSILPDIAKNISDGKGILASISSALGKKVKDAVDYAADVTNTTGDDEESWSARAAHGGFNMATRGVRLSTYIPHYLNKTEAVVRAGENAAIKLGSFAFNASEKLYTAGSITKEAASFVRGAFTADKYMGSASGDILVRLGDQIKGFLQAVAKYIPGGKIGSAVVEVFEKLMTEMSKRLVSPAVMAKAAARLVPFLKPFDAAAGFLSGYQDCNSIFGITHGETMGMKLCAGLIRAANNFFLLGIIPEKWFINLVMEVLGPLVGCTDSDIQNLRRDSESEVDKYNKENGTEYSVEQYNKKVLDDKTIFERAEDMFSGAVDGISNIGTSISNGISGATDAAYKTLSSVVDGALDIGSYIGTSIKENLKWALTMQTTDENGLVVDESEVKEDDPLGGFKKVLNIGVTASMLPLILPLRAGNILYDSVKPTIDGIMTDVTTFGSSIASMVQGNIDTAISGDVDGLWTDKEGDQVNSFTDGIKYVINTASRVSLTPIATVSSGVHAIYNGIKSILSGASSGIPESEIQRVDAGQVGTSEVFDTSSSYWNTGSIDPSQGPMQMLGTIGHSLYKMMMAPVVLFRNLLSSVSDAINNVKNFASNTWTSISNTASDAWNTASNAANNAKDAAGNAVSSMIPDWAKNLANQMNPFAKGGKGSGRKKFGRGFAKDLLSQGYQYGTDNDGDSTKDPSYPTIFPTNNTKPSSAFIAAADKQSRMDNSQFYSQLDPQYAMKYNTSQDSVSQSMSDSGCGPVTASNIISQMTGQKLDPRDAAKYALQNGYKEKDGGTNPDYFRDVLGKFGINSGYANSKSAMLNSMRAGNPVILMGQDGQESGKTPFGSSPHYVVGSGLDSNGNMIVQDPESMSPNSKYKMNDVLGKTTLGMTTGGEDYNKIDWDNDSLDVIKAKNLANARYGENNSLMAPTAAFGRRFGRGRGRIRFGMGDGGSDRGQYIYDYLTKKAGMSAYAASGIIGNLMQESSSDLNPRLQEGGTTGNLVIDGKTGYGLAQWTDAGRQQNLYNYAMANGGDPGDLDTQLGFLMKELDERGLIGKMNNAGSAREATQIFCDEFEAPDPAQANMAYRYSCADTAFQNQGKGLATAGTNKGTNGGKSGTSQSTDAFSSLMSSMSSAYTNLIAPIAQAGAAAANKYYGIKANSGNSKGGTNGGSMGKVGGTAAANNAEEYLLNNIQGSVESAPYMQLRGDRYHKGVDIAADEGLRIPSPVNGTVTTVDVDPNGYGNYTVVTDNTGRTHLFGHMQSLVHNVGDKVSRGDDIGPLGNTGSSTGPHTHYETREAGEPVDPAGFTISGLGKGPEKPSSFMKIGSSTNDKKGIGGPSESDYTSALNKIVELLTIIAGNTDKLGQLDAALSGSTTPTKVTASNKDTTIAGVRQKLGDIFGSKNGSGDSLMMQDIANITRAMDAIAEA